MLQGVVLPELAGDSMSITVNHTPPPFLIPILSSKGRDYPSPKAGSPGSQRHQKSCPRSTSLSPSPWAWPCWRAGIRCRHPWCNQPLLQLSRLPFLPSSWSLERPHGAPTLNGLSLPGGSLPCAGLWLACWLPCQRTQRRQGPCHGRCPRPRRLPPHMPQKATATHCLAPPSACSSRHMSRRRSRQAWALGGEVGWHFGPGGMCCVTLCCSSMSSEWPCRNLSGHGACPTLTPPPPPSQTEVVDVLAQAGALHLLPPLDACPGGRTLVLGLDPHAPNPCPSLAQCLSLLNAGHLERSMHSMAMVYPMLLHRVARTLDTAPAGQERTALAAALRRRAGTASGSRFVGDVCAWDWRTGRPGSEACLTRSALFDS